MANDQLQAMVQGDGQKLDPAKRAQMESYIAGLMTLMHGEKTRDTVVKQLEGNPLQTVPQVANMINDRMEQGAKGKKTKVDFDVKLAAAQYLVSDLTELGNASGAFKVTERQIPEILEETMKLHIKKGLKDGSIDPVELQLAVEPLMSKEQREIGLRMGAKNGVPVEPTPEMAQRKIVEDKTKPLEKKAGMLQQENARMRQMIRQVGNGGNNG